MVGMRILSGVTHAVRDRSELLAGKRPATPPEVADMEIPSGLSEFEALERLRTDGPNELPTRERRTLAHALVDVVREPMTALLLACGMLYFFLGDSHEAAMLLGFVGFIAVITLYQERKTERAIEALRELASPRALVIRD